jgi:Fe-S-cluster containining protein
MVEPAEFIDAAGKWRCTGCGDCCRTLGNLNLRAWPELRALDRGDGTCRFLDAASRCMIYETRPLLCRVDQTRPALMNATSCTIIRNHVAASRFAKHAGISP